MSRVADALDCASRSSGHIAYYHMGTGMVDNYSDNSNSIRLASSLTKSLPTDVGLVYQNRRADLIERHLLSAFDAFKRSCWKGIAGA